ncbi:hypothetical protein [Halorubrum sp. SP9]|uniref:hypothetical protein n=1 Tax=Halorubrum sp. SP9 TaxID=1537267 RepID=UPI0010F4CF39|nr:hypothetical protein [Halorubrum sp. SP9]TKX68222.1 hypothetical protein EXE45_12135 [Halorubrum sp. SP9]
MRSPHRTDTTLRTTTDRHPTRPPTRQSATDTDATHATITHLRRALTASIADDVAGVRAALLRAAMTVDGTRYPDIAAAIRTAGDADPDSRTVRRYIRQLLRRLVAVVNCWEPSK